MGMREQPGLNLQPTVDSVRVGQLWTVTDRIDTELWLVMGIVEQRFRRRWCVFRIMVYTPSGDAFIDEWCVPDTLGSLAHQTFTLVSEDRP